MMLTCKIEGIGLPGLILPLILGLSGGCNVLTPKSIALKKQYIAPELIHESNAPIEHGRPIKWLDTTGWVLGIPSKVLLWDRRIDNHQIGEQTIETTAEYMAANPLPHIKVRVNQYAPLADFERLKKNKTVAWPYRYTLGLLSIGGEAIFPGRVFGGDHFNPFTQTVHLYSDVPVVALHELGHAKDFSRRKFQGTYALGYLFFPTWHETIASRDAMDHLYARGNRDGIIEANRILYPAYGTYIGNSLGNLIPDYSLAAYYGLVAVGHLNGRALSQRVDEHLAEYQALMSGPGARAAVPASNSLSTNKPGDDVRSLSVSPVSTAN